MTTKNFTQPRHTNADYWLVMRTFLVPLVDLVFRQPDVLTSGGVISCCPFLLLSRRDPAARRHQMAGGSRVPAGKKYIHGGGNAVERA
jgi:hypothetical protein